MIRLYIAVALLAILSAIGWRLHHIGYRAGIAAQQAVDAKIAADAQKAADAKTASLQATADRLQQERDDAHTDLDAYRLAHPVRVIVGGLCKPAGTAADNLPKAGDSGSASTEGAGVLQPQPERDIGHSLDAKAAEADAVNENYRVCRTAYNDAIKALLGH